MPHMDEEQSITNKDYRHQAVTTLAEDWTSPNTGVTRKKGDPIIYAGVTRYDKKRLLTFPMPNVTAMCLDQAYTAWVESQHFLQTAEFLDFPEAHAPDGTIRPKEDYIFFDLLQKRMIAIVFAYTALESFANESIPDDFIFRKQRDDKRCTEEYTKEQTEHLSLDIKLHEVLPLIFHTRSPKGGTIWNKYLFIKKLRDRIIHMKTKDRMSSRVDEENIWKELLDQSYPNVAIEAKAIIGYFLNTLDETERPRWYRKFPWKK